MSGNFAMVNNKNKVSNEWYMNTKETSRHQTFEVNVNEIKNHFNRYVNFWISMLYNFFWRQKPMTKSKFLNLIVHLQIAFEDPSKTVWVDSASCKTVWWSDRQKLRNKKILCVYGPLTDPILWPQS